MGWFSPLKGVYPGLAQIDKTLSVGVGETGIVRGCRRHDGKQHQHEPETGAGNDPFHGKMAFPQTLDGMALRSENPNCIDGDQICENRKNKALQ